MAAYQVKRFNWVKTPTAWERFQAWMERRALAREQFAANSAAASTGFAKAWTDQTAGIGEIAAKQANARIAAEQKAKVEKALAGVDVLA